MMDDPHTSPSTDPPLYDLVADILTTAEYDRKIEAEIEGANNLLTREAAAYLVVDTLGRYPTRVSVAQLKAQTAGATSTAGAPGAPGAAGTAANQHLSSPAVHLEVLAIDPIKQFTRKSGEEAELVSFIASDGTGQCRVVFWSADHIELVRAGEIEVGTRLRIENAQPKQSEYGFELSVGRSAGVKLDPELEMDALCDRGAAAVVGPEPEPVYTDLADLPDEAGVEVNIVGTILAKTTLREFRRRNGTTGAVINFDLFDGTGRVRVTCWDTLATATAEAGIGDQLRIVGGITKVHNAQLEIQTRFHTDIEIE